MANTRYTTPAPDYNPENDPSKHYRAINTKGVMELFASKDVARQNGVNVPNDPAPATSTAVTADTPATPNANDPVATYYNNLKDFNPGTDSEAIRQKAAADMQATLDAIDAKYVSIFAKDETAGIDRLGQDRAVQARSGLGASDFGAAQTEKVRGVNKSIADADAAAKALEIASVHSKINELATAEITARKSEALEKAKGLTALQENARNLIPSIAASGHDLSPEQKTALMRQTGYDELTFDTLFNSSKKKAEQIDYKSEVVKGDNGESTLLMYGLDPKTGELKTTKYQITGSTPGANIKVYDGRPYSQVVGADGNITLKPVAGFIPKPTGNGGDGTQTDRDRAAMSGWISDATAKFKKNMGTDGKVDPSVYSAVRDQFASQFPDKVRSFDDLFSGKLSATERKNLGLDSGTVDLLTQLGIGSTPAVTPAKK